MNDVGLDQVPRIDGAVPGKKGEWAASIAERSSEEVKMKCKEKITRDERKEGEQHEIVTDNGSAATQYPS
jgi:hypothetical protein